MTTIRLGVAALNQTPLDWDGNSRRIVDAIAAARALGAHLLCLPEMSATGYGCEDAFHATATWRRAIDVLAEVVGHTTDMAVSIGMPLFVDGAVYNVAAFIVDGRIAGFVPKQNLAGDGLHYEPRWFKPWPPGARSQVEIADGRYPIGDLVFSLDGLRIGFEICEDAWVHDRPGPRLAERRVDVIFNPSASHFAFGKHRVREGFVREGSRAFGAAYAYSNLLGNEAGRIIYDGHTMIAANGEMLAVGPRASFEPMIVTAADVDLDAIRSSRARQDYHPAPGDAADLVDLDWSPPAVADPRPSSTAVDEDPTEEDAFARAIALGLRDYLVKSRSRGFVVSLSGGADSAAVVALIATMVDLGRAELGFERLATELGHADAANERDLVGRLLTTAYQATANSSETTRTAAATLARAIGATHHELDIDDLVNGYTSMIERAIGRRLTWAQDDVALQNIQARVRAPSVWMLANIENKLLLTTSNRSEAAVGYATMDGDTAGGLAPIAGIDKAFLRRWLRWMEVTGPKNGRPIPALAPINALRPTAELRPLDRDQTDEDDLMPYPVLEAIEEAAIGRKLGPREVLHEIAPAFGEAGPERLRMWVDRFFRLWARNQWKRKHYAPALHVDDRNLDPKTWCRFPILSGGFERELRELAESAESAAAEIDTNSEPDA